MSPYEMSIRLNVFKSSKIHESSLNGMKRTSRISSHVWCVMMVLIQYVKRGTIRGNITYIAKRAPTVPRLTLAALAIVLAGYPTWLEERTDIWWFPPLSGRDRRRRIWRPNTGWSEKLREFGSTLASADPTNAGKKITHRVRTGEY